MCSRLAIWTYDTVETCFYFIYSKQGTIKGTRDEQILEILISLPCTVANAVKFPHYNSARSQIKKADVKEGYIITKMATEEQKNLLTAVLFQSSGVGLLIKSQTIWKKLFAGLRWIRRVKSIYLNQVNGESELMS